MFRRRHDCKATVAAAEPVAPAKPSGRPKSSGLDELDCLVPAGNAARPSAGCPASIPSDLPGSGLAHRLGQLQTVACQSVDDPGYRVGRPHHAWTSEFRKPWAFCQSVWREYLALACQSISQDLSSSLQLHTFDSWHCTDAQLLVYLKHMFTELDLPRQCGFSAEVLENWLFTAFCRYNWLPFHNFRHAFCVTQMMYCFIRQTCLPDFLSAHDLLILMFSAVSHDLDHPGFTNSYQVNVQSWLALRYNDRSPLENHHCATAFDLIANPATNLAAGFSPTEYTWFRKAVIRCILGTDLSTHAECVSQFRRLISHSPALSSVKEVEGNIRLDPQTTANRLRQLCPPGSEERVVLMLTLVKACDISNEVRPTAVAESWLDALLGEFFHQAEAEKRTGLPVLAHMDPEQVQRSDCQRRFITNLLLPVLTDLVSVLPQLQPLQLVLEGKLVDYQAKDSVGLEPAIPLPSPSPPPSTSCAGLSPSWGIPVAAGQSPSAPTCSFSTSRNCPLEATRGGCGDELSLDRPSAVPAKYSRLTPTDDDELATVVATTSGLSQTESPLLVGDSHRCRRKSSQQQPPSPSSIVLWNLARLENLDDSVPEAPTSASRKSSTSSMVSAIT